MTPDEEKKLASFRREADSKALSRAIAASRNGLRHHEVISYDTFRIRGDDRVILQEWDDYGNHRLKVGLKRSDWTFYRGIARLADLRGTSDFYSGVLPRVFAVKPGVRPNEQKKVRETEG